MMWDTREPFSTLTAIFYPIVGADLWLVHGTAEAAVMLAALVVLGLGTAWHHYTNTVNGSAAQDLDHAGMNATYLALAVYAAGGPWWVMLAVGLAAAVVVEYVLDHPNRVLMGTAVVVTAVAGFNTGDVLWTGLGLGMMAGGFAAWASTSLGRDEQWDRAHGVWHVATAVGTMFLYFGVGA